MKNKAIQHGFLCSARLDIQVEYLPGKKYLPIYNIKNISEYKGFLFTGHQCGDLCKMCRVG